jgi:hypothetical protein
MYLSYTPLKDYHAVEQYEKIKDSLPIQRGNVRLNNLQVLNAFLFVAEQGCKWRG